MSKVTEPDIPDAIAAVAAGVARGGGLTLYCVRFLHIARICAELIAGLLFCASQGAVLAACGRYMGWW